MTTADSHTLALDAFEARTLPYLPDMARYARSLTRDAADADDLVQETYLQAYRGRHTFRAEADARRWLFAIARNAFLRGRARTAREVAVPAHDAELESLATAREHGAAVRDGTAALLDRVDVGPAIARALDALPDAFREAVVLVDVAGLAYDEAAAVLGVPIGTVRSRLFRARRLLQGALLAHARDLGLGRAPSPTPSDA